MRRAALRRHSGFLMKDIYEVLRQKEIELVRLRKEVHALKLIIPLVQDDETWQADSVMEAKAALRKIFHNPDAKELTVEP
jgi:hypothetical protein